ncbi:MAG: tetratricopeptide repeat protein [Pseudanabaenaceae cyanobacterium]
MDVSFRIQNHPLSLHFLETCWQNAAKNSAPKTLSKVLALGLLGMGWLGGPTIAPVHGQTPLPLVPNLNFANLEERGIALARDAAQLAQFQQLDMALPRARLAVQLAPKAYQTHAVLGGIHLRREELDAAIAALNTAHRLQPDNAGVLFSLGSAYLRRQRYDLAVQSLQRGLRLRPNEATAIFDLGNAYFLQGRGEAAIAQYRRVLNIDKNFWAATNNIGLVEYERGNSDRAIALWEEATKQALATNDRAAEPKLAIAVALYIRGDRTRALALGKDALSADPRYGQLEFLKENLWGEKLLSHAQTVLANPTLQEILQNAPLPPRRSAR